MPIDIQTVENLAPDQPSLKAASKLNKPGKWPLRAGDADQRIFWGECQGSGSNPYRVMGDAEEHGYKCTCPSRKFPCKHVLALFWMFAEKPGDFATGEPPEWVAEWMGRRKKKTGDPAPATGASMAKSINLATTEPEETKPLDPAEIAKREKAAQTRREKSRQRLLDGLNDLENWISDQLRLGLSVLLSDPAGQCRKIAARLVDASATTLAGRIDEFPASLMQLPPEQRAAAAVIELSNWILLARQFRADPESLELTADLTQAMQRDALLESVNTLKITGQWEVVGEQVSTQRDGLVRQSTWLWRLDAEPHHFALLLDYFPAAAGKRASSFSLGDQISATLAYYPAPSPLRATIADRDPTAPERLPWPSLDAWSPASIHQSLSANPWTLGVPIMLPKGRIGRTARGHHRWRAEAHSLELPLSEEPASGLLGLELNQSVVIWNGLQAQLLAAETRLGRCYAS